MAETISNRKGEDVTDAEPLLFDARLVPHRSLSPTGFGILMAAIAGISFTAGLAFYLIGAWPVIGFMGIDVALIYFAFRVSYARAKAVETIQLRPSMLTIERTNPRGISRRVDLQPYWLNVHYDADHDPHGPVELVSHGRAVRVGWFLGPEQRRRLAEDLRQALRRLRSPIFP